MKKIKEKKFNADKAVSVSRLVLPAYNEDFVNKITPIVEELRDYLEKNPEDRRVALWTMVNKTYSTLKELAGKTCG